MHVYLVSPFDTSFAIDIRAIMGARTHRVPEVGTFQAYALQVLVDSLGWVTVEQVTGYPTESETRDAVEQKRIAFLEGRVYLDYESFVNP